MKTRFRSLITFICLLFLVGGCSLFGKKPEPPRPTPKPEPFLKSIEHPFLKVNGSRMTEPAGELDFGALPAAQEGWDDAHKYMNWANSMAVYIHNTGDEAVKLASMKLTDVQTEEPANPFDTCGLEFPGFEVGPGEILPDRICYFPTLQARSRVTVTYYDADGNPVLAVPVTGTGRALGDYEPPPMGARGDYRIKQYKPEEEVRFENGLFMKGGVPIGVRDGGRAATECTLAITGGGHIPNPKVSALGGTATNTHNLGLNQGVPSDEINTGQYVTLALEITGGDGVQCQLVSTFWRIGGRVLWDYQEDFRGSIASIQFDAAKSRMNPIQLYWKNTGTHTVYADVAYKENGVDKQATVQRDFVVETDQTDIDRQMEDFYVWNHKAKVLIDHRAWHYNSTFSHCASGEAFFTFHKGFIGAANHWRLLFNYPVLTAWDPGASAPPTDPATNHNARGGGFSTVLNAKPGMYDLNGNGRNVIGRCPQNAGVKKLKDFATAKHLSDEMEFGWHGRVHVNVGGEMSGPSNSPKDPVFYKWHKMVDEVYDQYR